MAYPVSNSDGFTEIAEGDAGAGVSYYAVEKIGGAPSQLTMTWTVTDENAGQMIELVPEDDNPTAEEIADTAANFLVQTGLYMESLQ